MKNSPIFLPKKKKEFSHYLITFGQKNNYYFGQKNNYYFGQKIITTIIIITKK